jgi:hypothetical protein
MGWTMAIRIDHSDGQCGVPCPDDIAVTTLTRVGAGCITIGPFAAFAC